MKVVLDTNTIISALLWKGNEEKLLHFAEKGKIEIYLSKELFEEIVDVLKREKIQRLLIKANITIEELIEHITEKANFVKPKRKINKIKADPQDNKVLECALEAKAEYIVSGDIHLHKLKEFEGIKIVKTKRMLEIIEQNKA